MTSFSALLLFALTAVVEIAGCYLPWLVLRQGRTPWLLVPAALLLAAFAWLLTLHPQPSGRVYAAYGGIYIGVTLLWLWGVDGVRPTASDWLGVAGAAIIIVAPRGLQ